MGNDSVKDKMKGGFNKAKGEVKDKVGDMADRTDMQAEGKKDKAKGEIQKDIGKPRINFQIKINRTEEAGNEMFLVFFCSLFLM